MPVPPEPAALPLPGAYKLLNHLPAEVVRQTRRLIYDSVANSVRATRPNGKPAPCNFGIGVTFVQPRGEQVESFLSALHLVPEAAYRGENPLAHTIEALRMERSVQLPSRMSGGFRAAQHKAGAEAAVVAVHAVFGLREPVDLGWDVGAGAMALVHNANGSGGVSLMDESGRLLRAVNVAPGVTLDFNGEQIAFAQELGLLYELLTAHEDELNLLG